MKCACGNETDFQIYKGKKMAVGHPRVSPYPVSFLPIGGKERVFNTYMGGFNQRGQCWFCAFPRS